MDLWGSWSYLGSCRKQGWENKLAIFLRVTCPTKTSLNIISLIHLYLKKKKKRSSHSWRYPPSVWAAVLGAHPADLRRSTHRLVTALTQQIRPPSILTHPWQSVLLLLVFLSHTDVPNLTPPASPCWFCVVLMNTKQSLEGFFRGATTEISLTFYLVWFSWQDPLLLWHLMWVSIDGRSKLSLPLRSQLLSLTAANLFGASIGKGRGSKY